jgi:hypothetical protein
VRSEPGMAIAAEYLLLLGISLLIFSAVFIGFESFDSTASSDATREAANLITVHLSGYMYDAIAGDASVSKKIDLPERICGRTYVVWPSGDGRGLCVLVGGDRYEAPVIAPDGIKVSGFMVSVPDVHRIDYDPQLKTMTLV